MTLKDREAIQRALGKIEGIAFGLEDKYATPLLDAIEVIDCVLDELDRNEDEGNERYNEK